MTLNALASAVANRLSKMNDAQLGVLSIVIDAFEQPIEAKRFDSDFVDDRFLVAFGDLLKLHHSLSSDYLDKCRFEAGLERIMNALGHSAKRPESKTNPGHDITVDGVRWSLKTEGARKIRQSYVKVGKYMELGGGKW